MTDSTAPAEHPTASDAAPSPTSESTSSESTQTPPLTFKIRKSQLSDLRTIASIGQRAFLDDVLFEYLIPSHKGTNKVYKYMYYRNLGRMLNPKVAIVVAEVDGKVAGFCGFERIGKGGGKFLDYDKGGWGYVGHPAIQRVERKLLEWQSKTIGTLPKGMNKEGMDRFMECEELGRRKHYAPWPERWNVQLLAVDPKYARRGIGKALLAHVIGWAHEEGNGVIVTIEASVQGAGLYRKIGFRDVGTWPIPPPPHAETPVMVYIPEEHKDFKSSTNRHSNGTNQTS